MSLLPPGWRLEVAAELPSTADAVAVRAAAGEAGGLALLALRQSAGRGRAGRPWASPPGNLTLSILVRPAAPAREAPLFGLLAGVALAEAAAQVARNPAALRLKWPNDLLLDGAKCAGILAESALSADGGLDWLSLGFGVNLAHAPEVPGRATAALGTPEQPEAFAVRLVGRLDAWLARCRAESYAPMLAAWQALGPAPGTVLALRNGAGAGHYAGLAPDGSLLLQDGDKLRRVTVGELDG